MVGVTGTQEKPSPNVKSLATFSYIPSWLGSWVVLGDCKQSVAIPYTAKLSEQLHH